MRSSRAGDEFHHQGVLFDAVDDGDIRMIQGGEHLGFARESGQIIGVVGQHLGEYFDGDVAIELGVGGSVDGTHAGPPTPMSMTL